jgi:hypothetical protein
MVKKYCVECNIFICARMMSRHKFSQKHQKMLKKPEPEIGRFFCEICNSSSSIKQIKRHKNTIKHKINLNKSF